MTVEKLRRVLWRVRERCSQSVTSITNVELRRAIMLEIGTDPRTYKTTRRALIQLQWIKSYGKQRVKLTGEDIE